MYVRSTFNSWTNSVLISYMCDDQTSIYTPNNTLNVIITALGFKLYPNSLHRPYHYPLARTGIMVFRGLQCPLHAYGFNAFNYCDGVAEFRRV